MKRELKCDCGYLTDNKKSFSNHIRFGCKFLRPAVVTVIKCIHCGNLLQRRKPSEQGLYCNQDCYTAKRSGELRGAYGSGVVEINGYLYEYNPSHPFATNHGYVAQHRLVVEKTIGRYLKDYEVAHHINETKQDNNPNNIEVMTKSQHSKHHQNFKKCKIVS